MNHYATNLGTIKIEGEQTEKFLQGQITVNPTNLTGHQIMLGAVCNPQGRIVGLFWLAKQNPNTFLLFMPSSAIEATIAHLKKYAVFFKVSITDLTMQTSVTATFLTDSPNNEIKNSSANTAVEESSLSFIEHHLGIQLILTEGLSSQNGQTSHQADDFYIELCQRKIPWIEKSAQSHFLPHNLNLPDLAAVDFKKGCFTGQEVIARMHYKGKLKSHMRLFTSTQINGNAAISPLDKIIADGKTAGEIICIAQKKGTDSHILALLKDSALASEKFQLNDENGPILELKHSS